MHTVEPQNKGQVGTWTNVRYSEVVLYCGVFVKKSFILHFYLLHTLYYTFYDILDRIQC